MKRYNEDFELEEFELTDELLKDIADYMDDEIREELHYKLAPCDAETFLRAYVERDPGFAEVFLKNEFSIEL